MLARVAKTQARRSKNHDHGEDLPMKKATREVALGWLFDGSQ